MYFKPRDQALGMSMADLGALTTGYYTHDSGMIAGKGSECSFGLTHVKQRGLSVGTCPEAVQTAFCNLAFHTRSGDSLL